MIFHILLMTWYCLKVKKKCFKDKYLLLLPAYVRVTIYNCIWIPFDELTYLYSFTRRFLIVCFRLPRLLLLLNRAKRDGILNIGVLLEEDEGVVWNLRLSSVKLRSFNNVRKIRFFRSNNENGKTKKEGKERSK